MPLLSIIISIPIISCSSDDDGNGFDTNSIIGSWYGTRTYYNPVGGTKYQYLTVEFMANGMGNSTYEIPASSTYASFTYSVNGNIIQCQGFCASTSDDEVEAEKFNLTLKIKGDRLLPQGRYAHFILTRDGSVMTNGDGNEVTDKTDEFNEFDETDENWQNFKTLKGTSWTLEEIRSNEHIPSGYYEYLGETITFGNEYLGKAINAYGEIYSKFGEYKYYTSSFSGYGKWTIENDESIGFYLNSETSNASESQIGAYVEALKCGGK